MPKERFYRLPEKKKMIIRDAAIKEFLKVPFEKASINKIIQNADISRGSFYTYFEDKRDVLSFIFRDLKNKAQEHGIASLKRTQGDFWIMMSDLLEFLIAYRENNDLLQLLKNVILFQNNIGIFEEEFQGKSCSRADAAMNRYLYENIDKTNMQLSGIEDFLILLDMGVANLVMTVAHYYEEQSDAEESRCKFRKKMEFLRYGVNKPR